MGIVGFLHFSLKCIELFAWPIYALAYPLFASIQAIETNSTYHMKNLVTYWILFSLLSLFELTFDKLVEWIPIWPYMKIIGICWLVIPGFGNAYYVYKTLMQMRSYANMQAFRNWLIRQHDVNFIKKDETFISVAEKFIKENGVEALEELISNQSMGTKTNLADLAVKERMGFTITKKKEMATSMVAVANIDRKESPSLQAKHSDEKLAETERKVVEAVEIKEIDIPPAAAAAAAAVRAGPTGDKNNPPASGLDKIQRQWTCAVCQVTTTSQTTLNSHLQGQKHKAKCQELKAKKQTPVNKKPVINKDEQANANVNKISFRDRVQQSKSKPQEKKHWCCICNVNCLSEIDLAAHLKGKKHLSMVQELVSSFSGLEK